MMINTAMIFFRLLKGLTLTYTKIIESIEKLYLFHVSFSLLLSRYSPSQSRYVVPKLKHDVSLLRNYIR